LAHAGHRRHGAGLIVRPGASDVTGLAPRLIARIRQLTWRALDIAGMVPV